MQHRYSSVWCATEISCCPWWASSSPWSNEVSYYLFLVVSLGLQMALYYFGMNRVYAVYAVAYDVLQEELPQPNLPVQM